MATFKYRAIDGSGRRLSGRIEAADQNSALSLLHGQGLTPTDLSEHKQGLRPTKVGSRARLTEKSARLLVVELSRLALHRAPLDRALTIVEAAAPDRAAAAAVSRLRAEVEAGAPLSHALGAEIARGGPFPPQTIGLVRAGEASGDLGAALARLARDMERRAAAAAEVRAAMTYPIFVSIVAIAVAVVLFAVVIPQFERLFLATGGDLSGEAAMLIDLSAWVRSYGLAAGAVLLLAVWLAIKTAARPWARAALRDLASLAPIIGRLAVKREVGRWAQVAGGLLSSGAPATEALQVAGETMVAPSLERAARRVAERVTRGENLSDALSQERRWPVTPAHYARIGEETRELGPMLVAAGDLLDEEASEQTRTLLGALGPAIILALGGLIGLFVAIMFSAMLSVNQFAF